MAAISPKALTKSPVLTEREAEFQVVRGASGLIATLETFRQMQGVSKAEVARRADLHREAVSRLLTADNPNPTLKSIIELLAGLDLRMAITIRQRERDDTPYIVEVGGLFGNERKVAGEDF